MGSRKTCEEQGQEGVNFAVVVRCINCGQRKMEVKSQDAFGAKEEVLLVIRREVYLKIW